MAENRMNKCPYISIRRTVVMLALIKVVITFTDDVLAVELVKNGEKCPSIPVISDSSAIVAFTSEIAQSLKLNILKINYRNFTKYVIFLMCLDPLCTHSQLHKTDLLLFAIFSPLKCFQW